MAYDVIDIILQFGSTHLEFLDFLVRREIDLFFDAIYLIVEPMIFIKDAPKVLLRALQTADHLAVFRELSQDRMMKVHWDNLLFWCYHWIFLFSER